MMNKAIIKILYRQVIDSSSENSFDKNVWKASYAEFLMKSQAYNMAQKHTTFSQMAAADGRANSLHYKSGFAAAGYIENLQKQIPLFFDSIGRNVTFDAYEFKVIESHILDIAQHKVAVHYTTAMLQLHAIIGDYLLLAALPSLNDKQPGTAETFMLKMQDNLSVISYEDMRE